MNSASISKLSQALSAHQFDGRYSVGTTAVVESLHADFKFSYEQIADIAGVSLAGLRRWRERNVGDRAMFEPLLKYAEQLVSGDAPEPAPVMAVPPHRTQLDTNRPHSSFPDTRQVQPLTIAEAKRGLAAMFGVDPGMIDIVIRG